MITTEQIVHTTNKGNVLNNKVYDFLTKMFSLVSATLPDFMEGQLNEFNKKKERLYERYARLERDPILPYNAERAKKVELLIAEDRFNQKLIRFNRLYRSYLNRCLVREQTIPDCDTTWIFQDFPDLITEAEYETQPATTLCDHIFDNYDLRSDPTVAKVIWEAEQEYRWFKAFSERRICVPALDSCAVTRDHHSLNLLNDSISSSTNDFASLIEPDSISCTKKEMDFGPINDEINRLTMAQMGESDPTKQKEFDEELKRLHKFKDMALERRQDMIRKRRRRTEDNIKLQQEHVTSTDIAENADKNSRITPQTPANTTPVLKSSTEKVSITPEGRKYPALNQRSSLSRESVKYTDNKQAPSNRQAAAPSHAVKKTRVTDDSLSLRKVKYIDLSCYRRVRNKPSSDDRQSTGLTQWHDCIY